MTSLTLSQAGIYRLQKLSNQVKKETGVRHRLSEYKDIMDLLRFSSLSSNEVIYALFHDVVDTISEDQRLYIRSHGILLPTVMINPPSTLENPAQSAR